ncbi:MAG TPA: BON domain-containing protein [Paraburkholderia sp.]|jgi:osmotically-inducible protein OsmY|nr:BON domain-containing protein [Paraburkholderia sp.]
MSQARFPDARIAAEATLRLAWDASVPRNTIRVRVHKGHITLEGKLRGNPQRLAALEDVTRLFGVTGVTDHLIVTRQ